MRLLRWDLPLGVGGWGWAEGAALLSVHTFSWTLPDRCEALRGVEFFRRRHAQGLHRLQDVCEVQLDM